MPTNCNEAGDEVGCCDSNDTVWYCTGGGHLESIDCIGQGYDGCGWIKEYDTYGCVDGKISSAPGDNPPLLCMGP